MLSGSIQGDAPRENFAEPLLPAPADQPEEPTRQSSEESLEQLEAASGAVLFAMRLRRRAAAGLQRIPVSSSFRRALPPMSAEETLVLSPWQKWKDFNRVPVKFILQIVLVGLVSAQTYFYASTVLPYFNQSSGSFASNFYGYTDALGVEQSAAAATAYGGHWSLDISTIPDFGASLESTLHAYEKFINESIDGYVTNPPIPTVHGVATCAPLPAGHNNSWAAGSESSGTAHTNNTAVQHASSLCGTFELSQRSPRGPYDRSLSAVEWRRFFDSVVSIELSWVLVDTQVDFLSHFGLDAFEVAWTLRAKYSFASAGQMRVVYSSSCQPGPMRPGPPTTAAVHDRIHQVRDGREQAAAAQENSPAQQSVDYRLPIPLTNIAQVVVSCWLFLLCGRSLCSYMIAQRELHAQQEQQQQQQPQTEPAGQIPSVVEPGGSGASKPPPRLGQVAWMLMIMAQCIVNVAASVTQCDPLQAAFFDSGGFLLGISVALTWFNGMRLFEYSPRYYLLVHSLSHGLPSVARFTLGCVPIFMAYVGAATVFFGRTSQSFGSIGETTTTLFSLLNGDTMLDTFDSIGPADQWRSALGRLFLGTFIMLFSYAVLNVFISIISQAWEEVHFEALVDGSPPDQLLPDHQFGRRGGRHSRPRGSQMNTVGSTGDADDGSFRCVSAS
eukprot:COSAG02_NODE_1_length_108762_cov_456.708287_29_plen_669_part_00